MHREKILIVEDDQLLSETISEMLELEGFSVDVSINGAEALATINRERPDLIVCDIMMPIVDGFELLRQVRSDVDMATIPFIFLTAKSAEQDKRLGEQLGADDYLTKPFNKKALLDAIALRLGKNESLEQLRKDRQQAAKSGENKSNQVLLRIAAVENDLETIRALRDKIADIDAIDEQGNSALMFAVMMRNEKAAQLLVESGANPNLKHQHTGLTIATIAKSMGLSVLNGHG